MNPETRERINALYRLIIAWDSRKDTLAAFSALTAALSEDQGREREALRMALAMVDQAEREVRDAVDGHPANHPLQRTVSTLTGANNYLRALTSAPPPAPREPEGIPVTLTMPDIDSTDAEQMAYLVARIRTGPEVNLFGLNETRVLRLADALRGSAPDAPPAEPSGPTHDDDGQPLCKCGVTIWRGEACENCGETRSDAFARIRATRAPAAQPQRCAWVGCTLPDGHKGGCAPAYADTQAQPQQGEGEREEDVTVPAHYLRHLEESAAMLPRFVWALAEACTGYIADVSAVACVLAGINGYDGEPDIQEASGFSQAMRDMRSGVAIAPTPAEPTGPTGFYCDACARFTVREVQYPCPECGHDPAAAGWSLEPIPGCDETRPYEQDNALCANLECMEPHPIARPSAPAPAPQESEREHIEKPLRTAERLLLSEEVRMAVEGYITAGKHWGAALMAVRSALHRLRAAPAPGGVERESEDETFWQCPVCEPMAERLEQREAEVERLRDALDRARETFSLVQRDASRTPTRDTLRGLHLLATAGWVEATRALATPSTERPE
jgi:hypothetical protein